MLCFVEEKNNRTIDVPVQVRSSRASNFLLALGHIEVHGLVWLRPLEVKTFLDTVRCRGETVEV